jgi:hypothetical protein
MDSLSDYKAVVSAVSRATGIPEALIFSRKRGQIYYDARWIAVQLLDDLGYYPGQIADLAGMSARHVNEILNKVRQRDASSWKQFGRQMEACRKALGVAATA